MNVALVTNLRAPYRTLQLNEFSKIDNVNLKVYYTDNPNENRKWKTNKVEGFTEIDLDRYKTIKKIGPLNKGLIKIVKNNDLLILGGYEKPTYIFLSLLCKVLKKKFILLFDGISANRIEEKEKAIKKVMKSIVIKNARFIFGNGEVSKRYFNAQFSYPINRIYNQVLTIDTKRIEELYRNKENYREMYRKKLGISKDKKVLIYSGRLIDIKNIETVINSISKVNKDDLEFWVIGGGNLENKLKERADKLGITFKITGFISDQEELFKHYFIGDAFILPSTVEPWGLVVNEAIVAGLPVIVSKNCGCAMDLVVHGANGYIIDPLDEQEISRYIEKLLYYDDKVSYSKKSKEISEYWNFKNSKKNLEEIISCL